MRLALKTFGIFNCIISLLIFPFFSFASDSYTLEKITVKTNESSNADFSRNNSFQSFSPLDIKEKNLNTVVDLLDYASGLDLRSRGSQGIQGDLSLRGSTFEQVALLVDGINVNDPQTGHHNLDIPLTIFDIERVELTKEGSSSLYGRGALAGSVNIITKKPKKKALNLENIYGENAFFGQTMSLTLPGRDFSGRISFDHKISKAARPNTDFEYNTASFYLNCDSDNLNSDILFGYQNKDFGADSFYSNLFPEEEEHTKTIFLKTGLNPKLDLGSLKNNLFLRKHRDKFVLTRNNPRSVNYHTTYVYGLNSQYNIPSRYGDLLASIETGRNEINSTNLGKHARFYEAGLLGLNTQLGARLSSDLNLRLDHYQKWPTQTSFNIALGYRIIEDKLKIKGSVGSAFRIPSFTELYYSDPANRGDPNLKEEKSENFNLGFNFKENLLDLNLNVFLRRGHNLIDWTRNSQTEAWLATNLGRVDFRGMEFNACLKPDLNLKHYKLEKAVFSYNYTNADRKSSGFFSKYALDILKHQFMLDIYSAVFSLNLNWQLSYNQRYYGDTYFIGNLYIGKRLEGKTFSLEPFIKIDNFSNTRYTEIAGVTEPGRWAKAGLKFEW